MVYLLTYLRIYKKDESSQEKERRRSGWQSAAPEIDSRRHPRCRWTLQHDSSHRLEPPPTQGDKRKVGGVEAMLILRRRAREIEDLTATELKRIVNGDRDSGDLGTKAFSVETKDRSHQTTDQPGDTSEQLNDEGRRDDAAGQVVDEHQSTSSLDR
jgi:hypothetical protein